MGLIERFLSLWIGLAIAAGVDVTFSVGKGMQHVYPFLAGNHPRADEEIALMAAWYHAGRK